MRLPENTDETRDLLAEIRDLLIPISDAYRPAYERRLAIRALVSTDKRRKAWALADGTRTLSALAKEAGRSRRHWLGRLRRALR